MKTVISIDDLDVSVEPFADSVLVTVHTGGDPVEVFLDTANAGKLGEAIIKSAMPQNWDKDHLREITKPYPVEIEPKGCA